MSSIDKKSDFYQLTTRPNLKSQFFMHFGVINFMEDYAFSSFSNGCFKEYNRI